MAYDPHSNYQPPPRPYLAQNTPQAPAHYQQQNGRGGGYQTNAYDNYAQQPKGYPDDQQYGGYNGGYNGAYDDGMNQPHYANSDYGNYSGNPYAESEGSWMLSPPQQVQEWARNGRGVQQQGVRKYTPPTIDHAAQRPPPPVKVQQPPMQRDERHDPRWNGREPQQDMRNYTPPSMDQMVQGQPPHVQAQQTQRRDERQDPRQHQGQDMRQDLRQYRGQEQAARNNQEQAPRQDMWQDPRYHGNGISRQDHARQGLGTAPEQDPRRQHYGNEPSQQVRPERKQDTRQYANGNAEYISPSKKQGYQERDARDHAYGHPAPYVHNAQYANQLPREDSQKSFNSLPPPPYERDARPLPSSPTVPAQFDQRGYGAPAPQNGGSSRPSARDQSRVREPSRPAQRRPLIEPESPTTLPQDNAFPVFPVIAKKKAARSRSRAPSPARASVDSQDQRLGRGSDDRGRPSTATGAEGGQWGNTNAEQLQQRPGLGDRKASQLSTASDDLRRGSPAQQHRPQQARTILPGSSERSYGVQHANQAPAPRQPEPEPEPPRRYDGSEMQRQPPQHSQQQARQQPPPSHGPPPPMRAPERQQVQAGYVEPYATSSPYDDPRGAPPEPTRGQDPRQNIQPPPKSRERPNIPPVDTRPPRQFQAPGYGQGPIPQSPIRPPQRPATSASNKPPQPAYRDPYPQSAGYEQPPKPWNSTAQTKHQSLGGIYDDYGATDVPDVPPFPSREAEIEAEMPDFDNMDQSSSSNHGRTKTLDHHLVSPVHSEPPPMPAPSYAVYGAQDLPPPKPGFYQHTGQASSQPNLGQSRPHGDGRHGAGPDGFVFGVPGEEARLGPQGQGRGQGPSHGQRQQTLPYRQGPSPHYQDGPVNGQPMPRRSMDEARQRPMPRGSLDETRPRNMPPPGRDMRQGPPGQRGPPGPYGQRPDPRNYNAQSQQSDPGAGAPRPRMGSDQPPRQSPMGAPLSKQRSPEQMQPPPRPGSNPDSLPNHPIPIRPGLMDQSPPQAAKPAPVRQYNGGSAPNGSSHAPSASITSLDSRRPTTPPVTQSELDTLRSRIQSQPSDYATGLTLVKKLVEASSILAPSPDAKTTAKKREEYIFAAHKLLKKLVGSGYAPAQFYMADCYGQGLLGLAVDTKEAFQLYQAAAKAGHGPSAYRTAVCCEMGPDEGGGTRRDVQKAVQWYRRAAQLQDVPAMYKLGMILLKGLLGQTRNVGEAITWLKRAAERADRENPHALHELGGLYEAASRDREVSEKVIPDVKYARELFEKAARLGYKFSQRRLGEMWEFGQLGAGIDARQSIGWYSKAAKQGEHGAELALSGWYLTGADPILAQSDTEAYLWARKAASSEPPLAKAMFAMGYYTETGIGCPQSLDEAKKWYGRAAAYKFPKAIEKLEELKRGGGKVGGGAGGVNARNSGAEKGKLARRERQKGKDDCVVM